MKKKNLYMIVSKYSPESGVYELGKVEYKTKLVVASDIKNIFKLMPKEEDFKIISIELKEENIIIGE